MYKRYTSEQRSKISTAAKAVRAKGGSWREAFEAAKNEGYNSSIVGLQKLVKKPIKGKAGRPKGSKNKPKENDPSNSFSEIDALVDRLANERALDIIENAFATAKSRIMRKIK